MPNAPCRGQSSHPIEGPVGAPKGAPVRLYVGPLIKAGRMTGVEKRFKWPENSMVGPARRMGYRTSQVRSSNGASRALSSRILRLNWCGPKDSTTPLKKQIIGLNRFFPD